MLTPVPCPNWSVTSLGAIPTSRDWLTFSDVNSNLFRQETELFGCNDNAAQVVLPDIEAR